MGGILHTRNPGKPDGLVSIWELVPSPSGTRSRFELSQHLLAGLVRFRRFATGDSCNCHECLMLARCALEAGAWSWRPCGTRSRSKRSQHLRAGLVRFRRFATKALLERDACHEATISGPSFVDVENARLVNAKGLHSDAKRNGSSLIPPVGFGRFAPSDLEPVAIANVICNERE